MIDEPQFRELQRRIKKINRKYRRKTEHKLKDLKSRKNLLTKRETVSTAWHVRLTEQRLIRNSGAEFLIYDRAIHELASWIENNVKPPTFNRKRNTEGKKTLDNTRTKNDQSNARHRLEKTGRELANLTTFEASIEIRINTYRAAGHFLTAFRTYDQKKTAHQAAKAAKAARQTTP